jgi:hypothetical protein
MAIDFNQSDEQRESLGAIPAGSMVKVRMTIRQPEAGFVGSDPMLKLSKKADCEMLDCEFEVIAGQFATRKIWNNYIVGGASAGHAKAAQISMRTMRAIVEAMRGISPKDASPAATKARVITQWGDLQGAEFGAVVGIDQPKPGDRYVNNTIKRIVTADDEQYGHIMAGGEILTDAPIPEIPQTTQSAAPRWAAPKAEPAAPAQGTLPTASAAPKQAWQAPKTAAPTAPTGAPATAAGTPPPTNGGMPKWGAPTGGQMPPPTFPSQASGMDDVPF